MSVKLEKENEASFSLNSNNQSYSSNFPEIQGRASNTVVMISEDSFLPYPAFVTKNEDGKWVATVVNTLEQDISVRFTCNVEEAYCSDADNFATNKIPPCSEEDVRNHTPTCVQGYYGDIDSNLINRQQGTYEVEIFSGDKKLNSVPITRFFGSGEAVTILLTTDENEEVQVAIIEDIHKNDVSVLYIIPQYVLITASEIMVSITGLEFAYTQAPTVMRSVMTSFYQLGTSIGNIVVIIVAESKVAPTQSGEYYLFAGLCGISGLAIGLISYFYFEYTEEDEFQNFEYPKSMYVRWGRRHGDKTWKNYSESDEIVNENTFEKMPRIDSARGSVRSRKSVQVCKNDGFDDLEL